MKAVPVMCCCVVRIDLDCAPVLPFGDGPVEIMTGNSKPQSCVGFSGSRIEFDSLAGSLFRSGRAFGKRLDAKNTKPVVVIGDAGVGECIVWIEFDSLFVAV